MVEDRDYAGWAASYGPLVKHQMSEDQERHLMAIKATLMADTDAKYRNGQKEHGGDLAYKPGMMNMLWEEIIDLPVYFLTLRAQLRHDYRALLIECSFAQAALQTNERNEVAARLHRIYELAEHLEAIVEGKGD